MLKEINSKNHHCFIDENDNYQGENRYQYDTGPCYRVLYHNGKMHGEGILYDVNDKIHEHVFFVNDTLIHNQLKNPLSDDELLLLCIEHGIKRLPNIPNFPEFWKGMLKCIH